MTLYEKIDFKKVLTSAWSCIHCGLCRQTLPSLTKSNAYADTCPAGLYFNFESYYSPGRNEVVRAILRSEFPLDQSEKLLDVIYSCTTCGACEMNCEYINDDNVTPTHNFEKIRAYLVNKGVGPLPAHVKISQNTNKFNNPYGESEPRNSWAGASPSKDKESADVFYFVGCTSGYRNKDLAINTAKIFDALGVKYTISTKEVCCGSPLLRTGQLDQVERLVKENIAAIDASGAKTVVFSCAGCYRTVSLDWPEILGKELGFETLHISEYLAKQLKKKSLKFKNAINMKVAYHDPCHLGRHMRPKPVYEEPRFVLDNIPGLDRKIFQREKDSTLCCGAGGGVKSGLPEYSEYIASLRVTEARSIGAETIVTACPFCVRGLNDGAKSEAKQTSKPEIAVKDLTEVVCEAMGLKKEVK